MLCPRFLHTWRQSSFFILLIFTPFEDSSFSYSAFSYDPLDHSSDELQNVCTDRFGYLDPQSFNRRSCAFCYVYLFPKGKPLVPLPPFLQHLVFIQNSSIVITPDPFNASFADQVCSTLNQDECRRWVDCCKAAFDCCEVQLSTPHLRGIGQSYCGRIWDGYSCWKDTPAGTTVSTQCPSHLVHSITSKSAIKTCTANGTWLEKGGYQWTDYTPCVDKQVHLIGVYMSFGCNALGLLLLVPAIAIFSTYRELLKQHRIRIHINFFASLVLYSCSTIAWYYLVHYDLLVNPIDNEAVVSKNPVWCRILSFVKIYSTGATYFWMFNEGFYLHRLITNTFEPPKSLQGLCLYGWLTPALCAIVYSIIRATLNNTSCWVKSFGDYEWVIYAPNFFCMVLNFIFLCNILRILMFRLHSHPHEPSNFRRGVKAAFMLIPLFGLQLFLTIYRPRNGMQSEMIHEFIFIFNTNSQGIFVSLIFCFFNSEVLSRLPYSLNRLRCCSNENPSSPHSRGVSNQLTHFTLGDMRHSMSNMAFYPGFTSSQNGRLLTSGGSFFAPFDLQKNPSPTSCHSLTLCTSGALTPDRKRKSSSMSTATEVDHMDQRSPDSPPKYSTLQRPNTVSPGKGQSKYAALPTSEGGI